MTKQTAEKLAQHVIGIWSQSKVERNINLGETGYYVLATQQERPIDTLDRFDCTEFSDEKEAIELMEQ
jgi:hypothetical protein